MPDELPGFNVPYPAFPAFETLYNTRTPQLVMRKIVGDLHTPVGAYLKLAGDKENCFLLESIEGGDRLGRYSIIGLDPDLIWRADKDQAFINSDPQNGTEFVEDSAPTLESLKTLLTASRIDINEADKPHFPPMAGGLFGYFGYDTIRLIEKLGPPRQKAVHTPDAIFVRPEILVVFDNVKQEIFFISPVRPKDEINARAIYDTVSKTLEDTINLLNKAAPITSPTPPPHAAPLSPSVLSEVTASNTPKNDYISMVEKAKQYIRAGDIFQVVLSQRFSMNFPTKPFELYRALRRLNPSPFLFFLNFSTGALVGSSPEILVRIRDNEITIRPIAGTRKRGLTPQEDKALAVDLLEDPKERAEHLMLLDLGRNDVGRAAKIGSVKVTDKFLVERYSHVMHIVSNVTGELADNIDPVDALLAGFPAGTVSGAPKIRAMEIIDELEPEARGPYGGCIGYFSVDGSIDSCIALRTALVKDNKMHVHAGAGIVADSIPDLEHAECENKAGALIAAAKSCLTS